MYFDVIKSTQEYIGGYSSQNKSNTSDLCEKKMFMWQFGINYAN